MAQSPNDTAGVCRCKSTQIRRREAEEMMHVRSGGNATATVFRSCFLGVYASLKSRNVSVKLRSCCQILFDNVHVFYYLGSSTLTYTHRFSVKPRQTVSKVRSANIIRPAGRNAGGLKPQNPSFKTEEHAQSNVVFCMVAVTGCDQEACVFFWCQIQRTIKVELFNEMVFSS